MNTKVMYKVEESYGARYFNKMTEAMTYRGKYEPYSSITKVYVTTNSDGSISVHLYK